MKSFQGKATIVFNENETNTTATSVHGAGSLDNVDKKHPEHFITVLHHTADKIQGEFPSGNDHVPGKEEKLEHHDGADNTGTSQSSETEEGAEMDRKGESQIEKKDVKGVDNVENAGNTEKAENTSDNASAENNLNNKVEKDVNKDGTNEKDKEKTDKQEGETKDSPSSLVEELITGIGNLYSIFHHTLPQPEPKPSKSTENDDHKEKTSQENKDEQGNVEKGKETGATGNNKKSESVLDSLVSDASHIISLFGGNESGDKGNKDNTINNNDKEKHPETEGEKVSEDKGEEEKKDKGKISDTPVAHVESTSPDAKTNTDAKDKIKSPNAVELKENAGGKEGKFVVPEIPMKADAPVMEIKDKVKVPNQQKVSEEDSTKVHDDKLIHPTKPEFLVSDTDTQKKQINSKDKPGSSEDSKTAELDKNVVNDVTTKPTPVEDLKKGTDDKTLISIKPSIANAGVEMERKDGTKESETENSKNSREGKAEFHETPIKTEAPVRIDIKNDSKDSNLPNAPRDDSKKDTDGKTLPPTKPETVDAAVQTDAKKEIKEPGDHIGSSEKSKNLVKEHTEGHDSPVKSDPSVLMGKKEESPTPQEHKVSVEDSKNATDNKIPEKSATADAAVHPDVKDIKESKDNKGPAEGSIDAPGKNPTAHDVPPKSDQANLIEIKQTGPIALEPKSSVNDSKKGGEEKPATVNTDNHESKDNIAGNENKSKQSDNSAKIEDHKENLIHEHNPPDTPVKTPSVEIINTTGSSDNKQPSKIESKYDLLDFKIPNSDACSNKGENVNLLIVITSLPKNVEFRNAVRKTWGKMAIELGFRYMFFLGFDANDGEEKSIMDEAKNNHDILQTSLADQNNTQTEQSVMLMKWLKSNCASVKYVLKIKDHAILNCPEVHEYIQNLLGNDDERSIYGNVSQMDLVDQKIKSPLTYLSEEGYLFPRNLASELYDAAEYEITIPFETIYMTGLLAEKLKIPRKNVPKFSEFKAKVPSTDPCVIFQSAMIIYPFAPNEMLTFWAQLEGRHFCKESKDSLTPGGKLLYSSSLNNKKIPTDVNQEQPVQEVTF